MVRSWIPSFLIPFSCHSFLLKTCKKKLWMVRSWVPSFLIPVSFQSSLSNRSRNELWMGRYGGRAGRTTNTLLSPSILSNVQSFHGSTTYSIYSFVQLSWHSTGENDFWMVDLGFLLLSSPFPFKVSLSNSSKNELWMGKCGGRGKAHHKHTLSILSQFQSFHGSRGYSIDSFGSCPGTALVRMVGLGFLLFSSSFPFKVSFSNSSKNELWMGTCG